MIANEAHARVENKILGLAISPRSGEEAASAPMLLLEHTRSGGAPVIHRTLQSIVLYHGMMEPMGRLTYPSPNMHQIALTTADIRRRSTKRMPLE